MKKRYLLLPMLLLSMVVFAAERKSIYDLFYSGDGTVSSPSYSFSSDKDTGLYTSGANTLNLATNGTLGLTLNSDQSVDIGNLKLLTNTLSSTDTNGDLNLDANGTGSIVAADDLSIIDGSTSIPGLNFTSDENTGIYRSTTDTLGLISGGYEGLQVKKSTGNYSNIGMGGNASVSDSFPLLIERNLAAGINVQVSNPNGGVSGATKIILKGDTGSISSGELSLWPSAQTNHAYSNRLVMRSSDTADGISIVGSGSGSDDVRIYNGGVASTNESVRFNADYSMQLMQEIATPATPATNTHKIYAKSNGKIYRLDDSGLEQELGAGGGSSGINFITNPDFETDVSDWSTYDDGASATPVDGTGGSPNVTFDRITTTGLLLSGVGSGRLLSGTGVNRQGQGVSSDIVIDNEYLQKEIIVKFSHALSSNTNSGEYKVFVYDVDNSVLLGAISNDDDGDIITGGLNSGNTSITDSRQFVGTFVATDSLNYRIIIHNTSSDTSRTKVMYLDTVKASPDTFGPGAIIIDWQSFTPTGSWTTNTTYSGYYRRVGDEMEIQYKVDLAGAPNNVALTFDIPFSKTIDVSKLLNDVQNDNLGLGSIHDNGTSIYNTLRAQYENTTSVRAIGHDNANLTQTGIFVRRDGTTITMTFGSGDEVFLTAKIPIENWSSSNLVSTQEANYTAAAVSTTNVQPTGTLGAAFNVIKFGTIDNDPLGLYNTTTGQFTAPRDGVIDVAGFIELGLTSAANITNIIRMNNTTQSKEVRATSFTPSTVNRARMNLAGSLVVDKDDVVEFQIWSDGSGLSYPTAINSFTMKYQEKFKSFGVYKNAEYIIANGTAGSAPTTGSTYGDITNIEIGLGTWSITAFAEYLNTGAATATYYGYAAIGTVSGNNTTGVDFSLNSRKEFFQLVSGYVGTVIVPSYEIEVTEPTTLYLKGRVSVGSATNITVEKYKIDATRIR